MSANVTEDEIRARIGAALSSLGTVWSSRMGAGNDDIEVPRRYLRALSDGGWAVPSWPAEYGGRGMSSAAGETVRAILAGLPKPDLYPFLVGIDLIGPACSCMARRSRSAAGCARSPTAGDLVPDVL